jgi:hypothetical protein
MMAHPSRFGFTLVGKVFRHHRDQGNHCAIVGERAEMIRKTLLPLVL